MAGEKPKKTQEDVAVTLAACDLKTDPSSRNISAGIIAENLARGAKGQEITEGARIPVNVGKCVADHYEGKKPNLKERIGAYMDLLGEAFSNASTSAGTSISEEVKAATPGVTNALTGGAVDIIKTRAASAGARSADL